MSYGEKDWQRIHELSTNTMISIIKQQHNKKKKKNIGKQKIIEEITELKKKNEILIQEISTYQSQILLKNKKKN